MLSNDRLEVLKKIKDYEKEGKWDLDVENDPETIPLLPNKVDYLNKKLSSKFWTKIANRVAVFYYERLIKKRYFVIKEIRGIENFTMVKGGAILTCNHFNAFDNYAVYRAIKNHMPKSKRLYKVIREGNFTNFKGLYGFMFKHCNTLPLSSNYQTMKNLLNAVSVLLSRGEKILIYPEQAMWWNYKKPRPLKKGAFTFAVKNNVPIIPVFITMEDGEKLMPDGSLVQEYTINFLPPIYKDYKLNDAENVKKLMDENFFSWKECYEKFYSIPLEY